MPIYMDLHITPGVTARQVAEAHLLDVKIQHHYLCKAMTYWLDEDKGCVFCLIDAPDKESVRQMHEKAHGLIPHQIIEVNIDVVKAFLGRIQDPEGAKQEGNVTVFSDPAFRIIVMVQTTDARLLSYTLGSERAQELLLLNSTIVQEQCMEYGGSPVQHREECLVASFSSPQHAVDCALAIRKKLRHSAPNTGLRIAVHAGVPVDKEDVLFGATIQLGQFLCSIGQAGSVVMSSAVRNLLKDNDGSVDSTQVGVRFLTAGEEKFLQLLRDTLAANWHDAQFDVPHFCRVMSISKSQLYRKCIAAAGVSPNTLLREYRLRQSLGLLRKEDRNVSQTTFDTGFSSPSYFTKCFQKQFGLQPLAYLKARV